MECADFSGNTALHCAAAQGNMPIVSLLIAAGEESLFSCVFPSKFLLSFIFVLSWALSSRVFCIQSLVLFILLFGFLLSSIFSVVFWTFGELASKLSLVISPPYYH